MVVYLNDQFVASDNATLHINDLAIQRGYGIFDFFRVRDNILIYVEDHLDRFFRSAEIMHLSVPYSKETFLTILKDLIQKNNLPEACIKIILTGGYSPDAYQPVTPNLIITQSPIHMADSTDPKPVSIITHEYLRDVPEAKTINYTMGIWLQKKIKENQADDVLYHMNGVVTEFPRCNLFIVTHDNLVITPETNALKGITRKKLLELSGNQLKVIAGEVTLKDLFNAKEAFLTSSTKRIQAIVKIDGQQIGNGQPGEITRELLTLLIASEKEYIQNQNRVGALS